MNIKINSILFVVIGFIGIHVGVFGQKTIVSGSVLDQSSKTPLQGVKVSFYGSKIATITDSLGRFRLETYYPVDSIQCYLLGYKRGIKKVKPDIEQEITLLLAEVSKEFMDIVVLPPDEFPSTKLHKKVVLNKRVNNKEKLQAYQYETYNKFQIGINNLDSSFTKFGPAKRLSVIFDYLDTMENKKLSLPIILGESISDFYFANNPKRKREIVKASKITGLKNIEAAQFLGDMYFDVNFYDNVIDLFGKSFISPTAPYARTIYKFYLDDSTYINNKFCYKLRFIPKREEDLAFFGEMWVHDTTYAIESIIAKVSPNADLNYIKNLIIEQKYRQIEQEIWMLQNELVLLEFSLTEKRATTGFYGRKSSSRKNIEINRKKPDDFYKTQSAVEFTENAKELTDSEWDSLRYNPLNSQEKGIGEMLDTLEKINYFTRLKKLIFMATTGFLPIGKIEVGNVFSLVSKNTVEKTRFSVELRTSKAFSKRLELGGKVGYGLEDERFKYAGSVRYIITPKKRGLLSLVYQHDLIQLGQSPTVSQLGSTFATVLTTSPLNKLTVMDKIGFELEKDYKKDVILTGGFDWKVYRPAGVSVYLRNDPIKNTLDTLSELRTAEFMAGVRWCKGEEFVSGTFERKSLRSTFPILSLQAIFGVRGIAGSMFNYKKLEAQVEHYLPIGIFGRFHYGANAGMILGNAAYPFLKIHEGNQSYLLVPSAYNKMNFMEFISDRYASAFIENHWEGLFFNWIPGINKLKWRLITQQRILYGALKGKHDQKVLIPKYVSSFGNVPYVECSVGIDNIFKVLRFDLVWRATHHRYGISPLGIRGRLSINF